MTDDKRTDIAKAAIEIEAQDEAAAITLANMAAIRNLIYTVRGKQVILDSDLAALYGVETRTLNQTVTRNPDRFPERFCFQLTKEEGSLCYWNGWRVEESLGCMSPNQYRRSLELAV